MRARMDNHSGSQDEYIAYLESLIMRCREKHSIDHLEQDTTQRTGSRYSKAFHEQRHFALPQLCGQLPANTTSTLLADVLPQSDAVILPALPPGILPPPKVGKDFQFINLDSGKIRKNRKTKRKTSEDPRWKRDACQLIQDTPQSNKWHQVLQEKGLYDILCDGNAVSTLLNIDINADPAHDTNKIRNFAGTGPLDRIKQYAQATAQRQVRAGVAMSLANLQMFLVLSCCAVLLETTHSAADVFDIVRICIGRNASSQRCHEIIKACQYLNRLTDILYMHGWGLRAGEAVLLWNRPLPFYYHLACAPELSITFLKERLCTTELASYVANPKQWTSIFVPNFVHQMLEKSVHVATISRILGYTHSELFLDRVNPWKYQEA